MPSQRMILLQRARDVSTVGNSLQRLGDVILMGGKGHHSGQGMSVQCIWNVSTACSGCQYKIKECYYLG